MFETKFKTIEAAQTAYDQAQAGFVITAIIFVVAVVFLAVYLYKNRHYIK
jgi:putative effector of murein hydrolase